MIWREFLTISHKKVKNWEFFCHYLRFYVKSILLDYEYTVCGKILQSYTVSAITLKNVCEINSWFNGKILDFSVKTHNVENAQQCGNYRNSLSRIFGKNFVKVTVLLNNLLLKSWFDEIVRQINSLLYRTVKPLLSRNFCQKCVRLNFCNFHIMKQWSSFWRLFHTVRLSVCYDKN